MQTVAKERITKHMQTVAKERITKTYANSCQGKNNKNICKQFPRKTVKTHMQTVSKENNTNTCIWQVIHIQSI